MKLINYRTNKTVREATIEEFCACAKQSLRDGGAGVVDGHFVEGTPDKVILDTDDEGFAWVDEFAAREGLKVTWEEGEEGEQVAYLR